MVEITNDTEEVRADAVSIETGSYAGTASQSAAGTNAGAPRKRRKMYWSPFMGCFLEVERKVKLTSLQIFCSHFKLWMVMRGIPNRDSQITMTAALELIAAYKISDTAPLQQDLKRVLADQRRRFLYGADSTSFLIAEKKRLGLIIAQLRSQVDGLLKNLHEVEAAEQQRIRTAKQKQRVLELTRSMMMDSNEEGFTIPADAVMEGKTDVDVLMVADPPPPDTDYEATCQRLSDELAVLSGDLQSLQHQDSLLSEELTARHHNEAAYALLLDYINSLPEYDKDGRLMSIQSVTEVAKMERKSRAQLCVNRIQIRFEMERPAASNDAFCGRRELLLFCGVLRSMVWIKSLMLWYRHVDRAKTLRRIGDSLNFNSAGKLFREGFSAFRTHRAARADMRRKGAAAADFFRASLRVRNEAFAAWVSAHRLQKTMHASGAVAILRNVQGTLIAAFDAWVRLVGNKKKAAARGRAATLAAATLRWADAVALAREVEGEVYSRIGRVVVGMMGTVMKRMTREWQEVVRRKQLALRRWQYRCAWTAWGIWLDALDETHQLLAAVRQKCSGIVSQLMGQWELTCLRQWRAAAAKARRVRLRFVKSCLWLAMGTWAAVARENRRQRKILTTIRRRYEERELRTAMRGLADGAAQAAYEKSLITITVTAWTKLLAARMFRILAFHRRVRVFYRGLVAAGLAAGRARACRRAVVALTHNMKEQQRVRRVLARARYGGAVSCLAAWNDHVAELRYKLQADLAARSPIITRWLQRPMVDAFLAWGGDLRRRRRAELVRQRVRQRIVNMTVAAALERWAAAAAAMVDERAAELEAAADATLRCGAVEPLRAVLAAHMTLPHVARSYRREDMAAVLRRVMDSQLARAHERVAAAAGRATGDGGAGGVDGEALYAALRPPARSKREFRRRLATDFDIDPQTGYVTRSVPPPRADARLRWDVTSGKPQAQPAGGGSLFAGARRAERASSPPPPLRPGPEQRAHAWAPRDNTAWSWAGGGRGSSGSRGRAGVTLGVTREHADAVSASSVPVPVCAYNYTPIDRALAAPHRVLDPLAPLPVPRTPPPPPAAVAMVRGGTAVAVVAAARWVTQDGGRRRGGKSMLGAWDLLPRLGKASAAGAGPGSLKEVFVLPL